MFRAAASALRWVTKTRPDILYDSCNLSSAMDSPTIDDAEYLNKTIKAVKHRQELAFSFPKLTGKLQIVCFADASRSNDTDAHTGYCIYLTEMTENAYRRAVPLRFGSYKQTRASRSPAGAELIALRTAHAESKYLQSMLCELNILDQSTPILMLTDSQDLQKVIKTTHKTREPNLMSDLRCLRQEQKAGLVCTRWIEREINIADELTHKGIYPRMLLDSIRSNRIRTREGNVVSQLEHNAHTSLYR